MVDSSVLAILAYGHILSAMGWLGGGILTTYVVVPNVQKLPPPARLAFNSVVLPRITGFVRMMIISTIVFGVLLLGAFYGGNMSLLFSTSQGGELILGALLALATAVIAFLVTFPTLAKISSISTEVVQGKLQAPPPEMPQLAKRARMGSVLGVAMLLIALLMMVSAGFGLY